MKNYCVKNILKFLKKICFVRLKYICECCILSTIGNDNKQMWFASHKEVRRMVEIEILHIMIKLLFAGLVSVTIITFALIIALAVIISKQK